MCLARTCAYIFSPCGILQHRTCSMVRATLRELNEASGLFTVDYTSNEGRLSTIEEKIVLRA